MVLYKWDTVEMTFVFSPIAEVERVRTWDIFIVSVKLRAVFHPSLQCGKEGLFSMCVTIQASQPLHCHTWPLWQIVWELLCAGLLCFQLLWHAHTCVCVCARMCVCVCVCVCVSTMAGVKDDALLLWCQSLVHVHYQSRLAKVPTAMSCLSLASVTGCLAPSLCLCCLITNKQTDWLMSWLTPLGKIHLKSLVVPQLGKEISCVVLILKIHCHVHKNVALTSLHPELDEPNPHPSKLLL
jgi:hypothetical protein